MTWASKYRPQTFKDLVGQRVNAVVLSQMIKTDAVPTALLLSGASGTGKTTLARVFAHELGASDVIEVDAASHGGVADIRNLLGSLYYSGGGRRVLILDEAHNLSPEAFDALLKALEEPPALTTFVLVTTESYKVPKTVLSRLMDFYFAPVSVSAIQGRLKYICEKEHSSLSDEVLHEIAVRSGGNVRAAITEAEQVSVVRVKTLDQYKKLRGTNNYSVDVLSHMVDGDTQEVFAIVDPFLDNTTNPYMLLSDLTETLKDVMLAQAGSSLVNNPNREILISLGHRLSRAQILSSLKILWECQTSLRKSEVPRMNVYLVITLLSSGLASRTPKPKKEKPVVLDSSEKITMQEMRSDDL